jgi:hypothetical protein
MSVVDFASIVKAKKNAKFIRFLDAKASHAALEVCLFSLDINNLEELDSVKEHIKKTMKILERIGQDAEKESL